MTVQFKHTHPVYKTYFDNSEALSTPLNDNVVAEVISVLFPTFSKFPARAPPLLAFCCGSVRKEEKLIQSTNSYKNSPARSLLPV